MCRGGAVKKPTLMVAFIVSTAVHVGALSTNLLHVSAGSVFKSRHQTVMLHIRSHAANAQPTQTPEPVENVIPEELLPDSPEILDPFTSGRSEDHRQDVTVVKTSRVDAVVQGILPVKSPAPVHAESIPARDKIERPDPVPEIENDSDENVSTSVESREKPSYTHNPVLPNSSNPDSSDADHPSPAALASITVQKPAALESRKSESEIPAKIVLTSKPSYPRYCRLHEEEGTAVLSVEILSNGEMGRVDVVRSSGYRRLDEAAVKGIRKAELIPALKDGKKVTSVKSIAITFDLEDWGD
jgi:TonB family protein